MPVAGRNAPMMLQALRGIVPFLPSRRSYKLSASIAVHTVNKPAAGRQEDYTGKAALQSAEALSTLGP
jgi:hypothetical protein